LLLIKTMKRGAGKIKKRKSQAGFEYIIIGGFVLAVLIVVSNVAFKNVGSDIKLGKAQETVDTIAAMADQVNKLGPGNTRCAYIRVPSDVQDFSIAQNQVVMKLEAYGKTNDVVSELKNSFATGKMPSGEGRYRICSENSGTTLIGFYPDRATCSSGDGCRSDCSVTGTADPDCNSANLINNPGGFNYGGLSTISICGNGVLEGNENCEIGNTNACTGSQSCLSNTCTCGSTQVNQNQKCGNGIREGSEKCDPPMSGRYPPPNEQAGCGNKDLIQVCAAKCEAWVTQSIVCHYTGCINPTDTCDRSICECVASGGGGQGSCPGQECFPDGSTQSVPVSGGTCGQLMAPQTCVNGCWTSDNVVPQCTSPNSIYCATGETCSPNSCTCAVLSGAGCSANTNTNTCSQTDDCPDGTCVSSGTGCYCDPTKVILESYGNGQFEYGQGSYDSNGNWIYNDGQYEACDPTAGNPTWQCRFTQNDHSTSQYECENAECIVLAAGKKYAGDFLTIGQTDQGDDTLNHPFSTQCNTIFETGSQNRVCDINGKWSANAGDSDKDGIPNSDETQTFLGYNLLQNNADTDGDGWRDGAEILAGYNPTSPGDVPANIEAGNGIIDNPTNAIEQCDTAGISSYCSVEYDNPSFECGDNSYCVTD